MFEHLKLGKVSVSAHETMELVIGFKSSDLFSP